MAKLLIAACAALFLLTAIVAKSLGPKDQEETIKEINRKLHDLRKHLKNKPLVPRVIIASEEKNLSIEEKACRGVKALKHLSSPEKEQFVSLNRSLAILSLEVTCTVNPDERYDLQLFG